jgi:hypothetical protein
MATVEQVNCGVCVTLPDHATLLASLYEASGNPYIREQFFPAFLKVAGETLSISVLVELYTLAFCDFMQTVGPHLNGSPITVPAEFVFIALTGDLDLASRACELWDARLRQVMSRDNPGLS